MNDLEYGLYGIVRCGGSHTPGLLPFLSTAQRAHHCTSSESFRPGLPLSPVFVLLVFLSSVAIIGASSFISSFPSGLPVFLPSSPDNLPHYPQCVSVFPHPHLLFLTLMHPLALITPLLLPCLSLLSLPLVAFPSVLGWECLLLALWCAGVERPHRLFMP